MEQNFKRNSTEIISPTRGEKYTIAEILRKGIERRGVDWVAVDTNRVHTCFYGSKDITVHCDTVMSEKPLWTDSVDFIINGIVPLHQTKDGKMSVGFGCGCDKEHGGQFPSDAPPSNKNWADYQKVDLGEILVYTENQQQVIAVETLVADGAACKVLSQILLQIFAEEFVLASA